MFVHSIFACMLFFGAVSWAQFPPMGMMSKINGPTVTYVQSSEKYNTASATTVVTPGFSSAITAGNTLVCLVFMPKALSISSIADTKSNTYTLAYSKTSMLCDTLSSFNIYYAPVTTAGTSVKTTATFSASATTAGISCHEFSKVMTNPLDTAAYSGTAGAATSYSAGPAVNNYSRELTFAYISTPVVVTPGAGWTSISTIVGNEIVYKTSLLSGTMPIPFTLDSANCYDVVWATFRSL